MADQFTNDLLAERESLTRLLADAQAGRRGCGDALGQEGCRQLAETLREAISNLDDSLRIIANAHRT